MNEWQKRIIETVRGAEQWGKYVGNAAVYYGVKPSRYRRFLSWCRRKLPRRAIVVLLIAAAWGQVKTVLLLLLGGIGQAWPTWALWSAGTLLSQVITLVCYWMTVTVERRLNK